MISLDKVTVNLLAFTQHCALHQPATRWHQWYWGCCKTTTPTWKSWEQCKNLDNVKTLEVELKWFERGVREAIQIRINNPTLNKDTGRYNSSLEQHTEGARKEVGLGARISNSAL